MDGQWDWELTKAARTLVRELFKLRPGETLAITADTETDERVVDATAREAFAAGAKPLVVWTATPLGVSKAADPSLPVQALGQLLGGADAWAEFNRKWLLYSTPYEMAMKSNPKLRHYCLTGVATASMVRCLGRVDYRSLKGFGETLADLVRRATHVRMTSKTGEDVSFENVPGRPVLLVDGYADTPGTHMMAGQVAWTPALESVNGLIVLDGSVSPGIGVVRTPVTMRVEKGRVVAVEGGQEAAAYEAWLRGFGHPQMLSVAHTGIGFLPGAGLVGDILEDQRVWGSTTWGFGSIGASLLPPSGVPGPSHSDSVSLDTTVELDGRAVFEKGRVVEETLRETAVSLGKAS